MGFLHCMTVCGLALALGCSADPGPGGTGRRDAGPGGASDSGGTGALCAGAGDCPGRMCSAAGRCIDVGTCLVAADCAAGLVCGAGSHACVTMGGCLADGDCMDGMMCDTSMGTCVVGPGCGRTVFMTTRVAPNVMILLDRSGSMDGIIGGRTRWDIAKEAVDTVTSRFDADIRFGLATYSSCLSGGCSAGSIVVPIADTNAGAIQAFLAPLLGRGSSRGTPPNYLCDSGDPETSTGRSLQALVGEASLQDATRANAVLLITDGAESGSCTPPAGPSGAGALLGQPVPVRTFAVGFSADTDTAQLMAIAAAGGTAMSYQADDAAALLAALDAIAGSLASCDYVLDGSPPDITRLYVYFNDDPAGVPPDPADGWTYDDATHTLSFHGSACMQIQSGAVTNLDVVFGCPGPILM